MNGYRLHLIEAKPSGNAGKMWDSEKEIILEVLEMYC